MFCKGEYQKAGGEGIDFFDPLCNKVGGGLKIFFLVEGVDLVGDILKDLSNEDEAATGFFGQLAVFDQPEGLRTDDGRAEETKEQERANDVEGCGWLELIELTV